MPRHFDSTWFVFESLENLEHDRCVDLFKRPDDSFGFEEFRRDVEDGGIWTQTGNYSMLTFASRDSALSAAKEAVRWMQVASED